MASTSDYIKSMYLDPKDDGDQNYLARTKKKKKKIRSDYNNVNIVDDDINLNQIKANEDDDEKFAPKEDKPTIENVKDVSMLMKSTSSSWKKIETKSTTQRKRSSSNDYELCDLRKSKSVHRSTKGNYDQDSDLDVRRKRKESDSDLELPRKKDYSDSDVKVRRRRKDDSDVEIRLRRKYDSDFKDRRRRDDSDVDGQERRRDDSNIEVERRRRGDRDLEVKQKRRENAANDKNERYSNSRRHESNFEVERKIRDQRRCDIEDKRAREESRMYATNTNQKSVKESKLKRRDKLWSSSSGSSRSRSVSREKLKTISKSDQHRIKKDSEKNGHHRKSKRGDESPVVKKINEISDTSSDEDIREKLKKLYDDPKGKIDSKEDGELILKYKKWSKGMKQVEDREKRLAEEEHEMDKPLARYKDDVDLDRHLKEKELVDDPMLEYFRKRKEEKDQQEQYEKTGEVWVTPKYESKVPPPMNRYNIWPGYRWDGIDRGNGFEARLLAKRNEKQANEEEDYKYGSLDL